MKFFLRIAIFLCAVLFLFTGCSGSTSSASSDSMSAPTQPVRAETARDLYLQALEKLSSATGYALNVTINKNTTVGEETFSETRQQVFVYSHAGSENMRISLEETSTIGGQSTSIQEIYADNTGYLTVNGHSFKSSLSAEEYAARNIPAAPLDIALYQTISAQEKNNCVSIQLSQPTQGEHWALPDGANMMVASGSATLDAAGTLTQSTYTILYTYGPASIELTANVEVDMRAGTAVSVPADTTEYTKLTYLDAPRILEQSCGYLLQSTLVSANSTSSITSPVSGIHHAQSAQLHMDMRHAALSAVLDTSVSVTDYSYGGETAYYTQQETFRDGQYQITINNDPVTADADISAETMRTYCQDLLVNSILLPDYMTDAVLTDLGSVYLLELTASEKLSHIMNESACQTLYEDPTFLTSLSSHSSISPAQCYLAIDKYTGLPTASGISSTSEYTIEDLDYAFHTQMDISYSLASLSAQTAFSETAAGQTNTAPPTPPFYHITGDKGQELWLLGTTTMGDARTSNLPQVIYDAFNASDALAVGPTNTAETQIAVDNQLHADLVQAYCYTDSTTADHVDAALYETALKLMKASGNYTADSARLKPVFWEAEISRFYLRQGYQLTPEQGAATQLRKQANTAGKTVFEITPLLSQVQTLGGLSDALQTALLADTVSRGGFVHHTQAAELFDLWCQGNEAALKPALFSNLPQMDAALLEEYTEAFVTVPNQAILDAAISYLESEQTVFLAVDLTCLLSDTGLLNTLADSGYTITQISYS